MSDTLCQLFHSIQLFFFMQLLDSWAPLELRMIIIITISEVKRILQNP